MALTGAAAIDPKFNPATMTSTWRLIKDTSEALTKLETNCPPKTNPMECQSKNVIFSPLALVLTSIILGNPNFSGSSAGTPGVKTIYNTNLPDLDLKTKVWVKNSADAGKLISPDNKALDVATLPKAGLGAALGFTAVPEIAKWLQVADFSVIKDTDLVIAQSLKFKAKWSVPPQTLGKDLVFIGKLWLSENNFATGVRLDLQGGYVAEFYAVHDNNRYTPTIPAASLPQNWSLKQTQLAVPSLAWTYAFTLDNIGPILKANRNVALSQVAQFDMTVAGLSTSVVTATGRKMAEAKTSGKVIYLDHAEYFYIRYPGVEVPILVGSIIRQ